MAIHLQSKLVSRLLRSLREHVAPRHHGGALGNAQIGLPQPHTVLLAIRFNPLIGRVQPLGIGVAHHFDAPTTIQPGRWAVTFYR
jgi:hypothetical protein